MFNEEMGNIVKETAPERKYTYGDYLGWSDEKRYELIDGHVHIMSPASYRQHQQISMELSR